MIYQLDMAEIEPVSAIGRFGPVCFRSEFQTGDWSASFLHFFPLFPYKNIQNFYSVSTMPRKEYIRSL
jgi:hypothetical protein